MISVAKWYNVDVGNLKLFFGIEVTSSVGYLKTSSDSLDRGYAEIPAPINFTSYSSL